METNYIKINGIPFRFLNFRGNAANLRIGESKQKVFIPRKYFNNDGTLKSEINLDWWLKKTVNRHKIELFKKEINNGK